MNSIEIHSYNERRKILKKKDIIKNIMLHFGVSSATAYKYLNTKNKRHNDVVAFLKKLNLLENEIRSAFCHKKYDLKRLSESEFLKTCLHKVVQNNYSYLSKKEYIALIKLRLRKAGLNWENIFGIVNEAQVEAVFSNKELHKWAEELHIRPNKFKRLA